MRKSKGLSQAYDAQNLCHEAILAWKREHTNEVGQIVLGESGSSQLSQLVKAFTEAQDRVRIHRNKPLPGSMRPEPKRKQANATVISVVPEQHADNDRKESLIGE